MTIYSTGLARESYMEDNNKTWQDLTDDDENIIDSWDCNYWEDAEWTLKEIDKQAEAFIIFGSMGLWTGNHEIIPEMETSLMNLISKIINNKDSIDISLVDGHIDFSGIHHDGSNGYQIYGLTKEGAEIFELGWQQDDMEELGRFVEFEEIKDLSKRDQQKKFWEIFMNPENEFVVKLKAEF